MKSLQGERLAEATLDSSCTIVTRPQPELTRDLDIYKTVARHHDGMLGVWTDVKEPGSVRVGTR